MDNFEDTQMVPANGNGQSKDQNAMVQVESSRAVSELQTMMTVAKYAPRSYKNYGPKIKDACQRKKLAEQAMYAYPRGGQLVTGPSIRLAEVLAQCYGNLDFGIVELEQRDGESSVMAYCLDLESNIRQRKVFTIKHERHTKKGIQKLKDPRDLYELVANMGARRLRACILGVVPGDVVDEAIEYCEETLQKTDGDKPMKERVKKMIHIFGEIGVTPEMLEKRLGHNLEATIETELVTLRKIFQSIKDGMAKREDFFEFGEKKETADGLMADLKAQKETKNTVSEAKDAPAKQSKPKGTEPQTEA